MRLLKRIINRLKTLFGYPTAPAPWQVGEEIVTQREADDCLVVAIANLCKISYEKAHAAVHHADLPFSLESPLLSNPLNATHALKSLGENPVPLNDIHDLSKPENQHLRSKVLLLIHNPNGGYLSFVEQHWVVWAGYDPKFGNHKLWWGAGHLPRFKTDEQLIKLFISGWPDCGIIIRN